MSDISLLLEIGTEEIPAGFLSDGVKRIEELAAGQLKDAAIMCSDVKVYATPRRIAIVATGVNSCQEKKVREVFGPPVTAAYDAAGNPTKAALGFAATNGVDVGQLSTQTRGKGSYIVARIEQGGLPVSDIVGGVFEKIIAAIRFPKMMRWAALDVRFARPICWLTALCGNEPVSVKYGGIESSGATYGHRFLSEGTLKIQDAAHYISALKSNYVIVDQDERNDEIRRQAAAIAAEHNASPVNDEELLETVTYIVEYPVCITASFPDEFLKLPPELLISVMRGHQKYFALERDGKLINQFIVVSNTLKENEATVRAGAERVIKARLEDAKFYYEQDLQVKLYDRIESLKGITFHDKLGSLYDKTKRLEKIIAYLAKGKHDDYVKAASLSKASLATGVVREFPELQGIMGTHYAMKDYGKEIAYALNEQYMPTQSGGQIPVTGVGEALSLADKLDNIVSFFSVGLIPTGSEDPFALRRQAIGLLAMLIGQHVTLRELFDKTISILDKDAALIATIEVFFRARLEAMFISKGYANDEVQAALGGFMEIPLVYLIVRLNMLRDLKNSEGCNEFLFAFKRIKNIVPDGITDEPNPDLFVMNEEKELHDSLIGIIYDADGAISIGLYKSAYEKLTTLITPINKFFDKVLVMDKDERLRANKLALLNEIRTMSDKLADVTKLQER
ncbi:MAG: glycine--tRNA ligase subunit beta [Candidatus Magnetominusculus sp. LBB02]|nr:glycine--tRNA ligase subunit beta [Candidatus Magnetominusculus sp. LBB02]